MSYYFWLGAEAEEVRREQIMIELANEHQWSLTPPPLAEHYGHDD